MLCLPFLLMKSYSIFLVLFMSVSFANSDENCVYKSTCECVFKNGSVVDLTSLAKHNSYRWGNLTAVVKKDNYTYYYNPCFGFSLGEGSCAKEVSACQVSLDRKEYFDIGDVTSVHFLVDNNLLKLVYTAPENRKTIVTLTCSEEALDPQLTVQGELIKNNYEMTLTSRCACPDLCRTSHLSAGSVLVIIFMIFVVLYLFLGIVHSSLTRGAHGWELIPHYEFWVDFPLLVRDGCVFVVSGCKSETAYERI